MTALIPASGLAKRAVGAALDVLLPPLCLGCQTLVDAPGALCPACWSKLTFLTPPLCDACGLPLPFEVGDGAICGGCERRPFAFQRARAALAYGEGSRPLILAFKHGDRLDGVGAFARWMVEAGAPLLATADLLAPIPLHWTRLLLRRYNQAAVLALACGRLSGKMVVPDLLVRRRRTRKLGHMSAAERRRTVASAFALAERYRARVVGRRVLLIDDVLTTGATVEGCARVLRDAGADAVDVLTLARTLRPVRL
jgi:ComF family protein